MRIEIITKGRLGSRRDQRLGEAYPKRFRHGKGPYIKIDVRRIFYGVYREWDEGCIEGHFMDLFIDRLTSVISHEILHTEIEAANERYYGFHMTKREEQVVSALTPSLPTPVAR